ncbi:MAG TPA: cysteine desulfurase [Abditibacteriaceae bacterium]|jgi:cysteine desulfurase/selenocysteine lyase
MFDVHQIRADFPILQMQVRGKPLVYLDNGATSQKPQQVLDALMHYYTAQNANIHRAVHYLSETATRVYHESRGKVQELLNAAHESEIIFTRGTTEAINLVAYSWGLENLKDGDEILLSAMEHHSNIVPWQIIAEKTGANIKVIPINDAGELLLDEYETLLQSGRVKLVGLVHISNALGTINPVKEMIAKAHAAGARVLIDGAQSVPHTKVDVQDLDADFYVFSGHKVCAPTGIGALYGKAELLNAMPPWQGGGDMISSVTWEKTEYNVLPHKFEAGTPDIAGVIGLAAAIDYVQGIGFENIAAHEATLLDYATQKVQDIEDFQIVGTAKHKASILSFVIPGAHPQDIGALLDARGVAIRTGHHCTQPLLNRLGLSATARASFAFYNTQEEVDIFVDAVKNARKMLL